MRGQRVPHAELDGEKLDFEEIFAQIVLSVWRGRGHWVRGGSRPGKEELKIAEYNIKERLAKGKGKRKEMGSGNESGGRKERTNGKKSGLIKEGKALKWKKNMEKRGIEESLS